MSPDDQPESEDVSNDGDQPRLQSPLSRRRTLRGIAALGTSATVLGAAGSASAQSTPHRIVVERLTDYVTYRIEVDGEIVKDSDAGWNDEIRDGHVAVGELDSELTDDIDDAVDDYRFSGEVVDFEVTKGKAKFTIERTNEKKVEKTEKEKEKRELSVHAHDPHVKYEFVVTGDVEPGEKADIGVGDGIDGNVVTGNVAGSGSDDYRFTGEIEKFHVTDPDEVTVRVDGEEVDPDDLGEWGHLIVHAHGPHVKYEFTTSGEFEAGSEAEVGTGSYIDGDTAHGNVAGSDGRDNYWYTGELTSGHVTDADEVTVRVDGTEVDPNDIGE